LYCLQQQRPQEQTTLPCRQQATSATQQQTTKFEQPTIFFDEDTLLPKAFAVVIPAPYILETRLKCLHCHCSFGLKYTFDRHVLQSHGCCVDSYPVRTNYTRTQYRRLVEGICTHTNNVHVSPSPLPHNRLKCCCCRRSYYKQKNFNCHVRQSKGQCSSSVSVSTAYFETADGKLVEIGVQNTAAPKIMSSILEATQLSNNDPLTPLILPDGQTI
jgi:hypothetical protein